MSSVAAVHERSISVLEAAVAPAAPPNVGGISFATIVMLTDVGAPVRVA